MNIKKIKPLFTAVVVTADIYPRDYKEHNIISPKANKLNPHYIPNFKPRDTAFSVLFYYDIKDEVQ